MKAAEVYAQLSYDPHTKVGCVLVKDNYIIAAGYNGTPRGCDNTTKDIFGKTLPTVIHAEMNAISQAAKSTVSTIGAVAYTTMHPCFNCAIHLYQAGITKVYYMYTNKHSIQFEGVMYESIDEDYNLSQQQRYEEPQRCFSFIKE